VTGLLDYLRKLRSKSIPLEALEGNYDEYHLNTSVDSIL